MAPIPATLGNTSRTDEFKKFPVTFTNSGAIPCTSAATIAPWPGVSGGCREHSLALLPFHVHAFSVLSPTSFNQGHVFLPNRLCLKGVEVVHLASPFNVSMTA